MSGVEIALAATALAWAVITGVATIVATVKTCESPQISEGLSSFNRANFISLDSEDFQDGGTPHKPPADSIDLLRKMKSLLIMQKEFVSRAKRVRAASTNDKDLEEEAKKVVKAATEIRQQAEPIISRIFNSRKKKGSQQSEEFQSQMPLPPNGARHFCVGAILYQQSRVSIEDLRDQTLPPDVVPQKGFVCSHCSLVVGNARTLRLSETGEVLASQDLLPASHLMACRSLTDFRALYRCVICWRKQAEVDFINSSDLERHMQNEHPGKPLILKEEAGTKVLERDVDALFRTISSIDQSTTLNQTSSDSLPSPSSDLEDDVETKALERETDALPAVVSSLEKGTAKEHDSFDGHSSTPLASSSSATTWEKPDETKSDVLGHQSSPELLNTDHGLALSELLSTSNNLHHGYTPSPRTPQAVAREIENPSGRQAPGRPAPGRPPPPPPGPQTQGLSNQYDTTPNTRTPYAQSNSGGIYHDAQRPTDLPYGGPTQAPPPIPAGRPRRERERRTEQRRS